jgi:NAD-dependent deacetylase
MSGFELPPRLRERLARVRSVGVITGAGVSAESGIQTYRGRGGIYDDPDEGERTIEALSGHTLRSDPDRTWRAIAKIARMARSAAPNPAHHAIARMERIAARFVLLTQNVDGLHQLAGSRNVIDIHGTVSETLCMSCGDRAHLDALADLDAAPRCAVCGGVRRPDAVLFGELLPEEKIRRIERELGREPPDLVIVAGTTALFDYIAAPALAAKRAGRLTVEVNPEPTPLGLDFPLRARAGEALPLIASELEQTSGAHVGVQR